MIAEYSNWQVRIDPLDFDEDGDMRVALWTTDGSDWFEATDDYVVPVEAVRLFVREAWEARGTLIEDGTLPKLRDVGVRNVVIKKVEAAQVSLERGERKTGVYGVFVDRILRAAIHGGRHREDAFGNRDRPAWTLYHWDHVEGCPGAVLQRGFQSFVDAKGHAVQWFEESEH